MSAAAVKKLHWHTAFGVTAVEEPPFRLGTKALRPFSERAGVACRAASLPLRRVLADFGADHAVGRAPDKLREHYGIAMPASTARRTAERHAQSLLERERAREIPAGTAQGRLFVGEMDGSMAPVVEATRDAPPTSARAGPWRGRRPGSASCIRWGGAAPVFGGHFAGGVEESGRQWARCAAKAGFGADSHLHAVGDGAPWIASQVEACFGTQGSYRVDFYHLCECLGAASPACAAHSAEAWLDAQKDRLKANRAEAVPAALAPCLEAGCGGPVADCDRHLRNRLSQLDYRGALGRGLPIGSGEIESAHRHVVQERLKLPGAWWTPANVEAMLALRLNRANRECGDYWGCVEKEAA